MVNNYSQSVFYTLKVLCVNFIILAEASTYNLVRFVTNGTIPIFIFFIFQIFVNATESAIVLQIRRFTAQLHSHIQQALAILKEAKLKLCRIRII